MIRLSYPASASSAAGDPAMTGTGSRPGYAGKAGGFLQGSSWCWTNCTDPSAAATMQNAEMIPSAINRSGQNFFMAVADPNILRRYDRPIVEITPTIIRANSRPPRTKSGWRQLRHLS